MANCINAGVFFMVMMLIGIVNVLSVINLLEIFYFIVDRLMIIQCDNIYERVKCVSYDNDHRNQENARSFSLFYVLGYFNGL